MMLFIVCEKNYEGKQSVIVIEPILLNIDH